VETGADEFKLDKVVVQRKIGPRSKQALPTLRALAASGYGSTKRDVTGS
jgi:hypothetical protein